VIAWSRPLNGAGCYCEPNSRKHKWGLVLETIHYALLQRGKNAVSASVEPTAPIKLSEPLTAR